MAALTPVSPGRAWWLAARPATLPASLVPVAVGTAVAVAEGRARALPALAALATALALQIGANLANDVHDFERGADTDARRGPTRATQAGWIAPAAMRRAAIGAFAAAALCGAPLVYWGGWPIALLGVLAIAAGWLYTGGPAPLGYHGLGDLLVFVFFGLVGVAGTHYVQVGALSALALAASLPVACLATAILVVNNLRDIETDRAAGKRTLAVRLGPGVTRRYYALLLAAGFAVPLGLWLGGRAGPLVLLPLLTAPVAWRLARGVADASADAGLNAALADTARLEARFGLLLAVGILA